MLVCNAYRFGELEEVRPHYLLLLLCILEGNSYQKNKAHCALNVEANTQSPYVHDDLFRGFHVPHNSSVGGLRDPGSTQIDAVIEHIRLYICECC